MNRGSGEIYFIQEMPFRSLTFPALVKVGKVKDKSQEKSSYARRKNLQTGNPRRLHLTDDRIIQTHLVTRVERHLHDRYATKRVRGEWFEVESKDSLNSMIAIAIAVAEDVKDRVLLKEQVDALSNLSDNTVVIPSTQEVTDLATEFVIADKKISKIKQVEEIILGKLRSAFDLGIDHRDALTIDTKKNEFKLDKKTLKLEHPDVYENYRDKPVNVKGSFLVSKKFRNSVCISQSLNYEEFISTIKEIKNSVKQVVGDENAYSLNRQVLELTEIKAHLDWNLYWLKQQLQIECGENRGIQDICMWSKRTGIRKEFNQNAFEKSNKQLFQQYQIENPPTISLTRWQIHPDAPT